MKAYLIITGLLFGVLSVLHIWRAIAEWPRPIDDPGFALGMAALVIVPGILSWWAWRLLRSLPENRTEGRN